MNNSQELACYSKFLDSTLNSGVKELEHIQDELLEVFDDKQALILLIEGCLAIPHSSFEQLHKFCWKELKEQPLIATKIGLCLNGETHTFWRVRREHLENIEQNLNEELHFNRVILLKFKGASSAFHYRLDVLELILKKTNNIQDLIELLAQEREFSLTFLQKHPRNYYMWCHRRKMHDLFKKYVAEIGQLAILEEFYYQDLEEVKTHCSKQVHEYSGFHYLLVLISHRQDQKNQLSHMLQWALQLQETYNRMYEGEQSARNDNAADYCKLESLKQFIKIIQKLLFK